MDSLIYGVLAGGVFYVITMSTAPGFPGEWNTGISWNYSGYGVASPARLARLALSGVLPLGYAWYFNKDSYSKIALAVAAGPIATGAIVYNAPGDF